MTDLSFQLQALFQRVKLRHLLMGLAGVRTTPVKRFPTRSLRRLAVYV